MHSLSEMENTPPMSKMVGVETAIRAKTIINRFTRIDEDGHRVPREVAVTEGLPEWAYQACVDHKIFLTPQDGYRHVWVETPYSANVYNPARQYKAGIYIIAGPECIMLSHGDGEVSVLTEPNWEEFFV